MVAVVVFEFSVIRCQPLRRALAHNRCIDVRRKDELLAKNKA
ncbi:acetyltransferase [Vibrio cholerae]|nr:acetyltransferase [Vibrio cholerae]